jgi:DNA-binding IclR family transcriptional regulator
MKNIDLVKHSLGVMIALRDVLKETVGLAVLLEEDACGIVIAQVRGDSDISFTLKANNRFPLHSTAPGKALCAFLPPPRRLALLKRLRFASRTAHTITSRTVFERDLSRIRRRGYSADQEEQVNGCHCVGAPILAPCLTQPAAIWVTGLPPTLPAEAFDSIGAVVIEHARMIEARLTGQARKDWAKHIEAIIEQARDFLDEHAHTAIDMEELARNLHVGYSWFRRMFKARTGQSPSRYHLQRRMEEAQRLLLDTDLTVKQIAERLGYKSQNYFSEIFKKQTGLSPNHFKVRRKS